MRRDGPWFKVRDPWVYTAALAWELSRSEGGEVVTYIGYDLWFQNGIDVSHPRFNFWWNLGTG